ncbi:hypothetical protein ACFQX6_50060 [Streptosporangium lutulentum]
MYVGLRGRLIIIFILIAITSSALVAGIGYEIVKRRVIEHAEQVAVSDVRDTLGGISVPIGALWPGDGPPTNAEISTLQKSLRAQGRKVVVRYEDHLYADGDFTMSDVPSDLAIRSAQRMATKRQLVKGNIWLIIGTPVWRIEPVHTAQPTGMSVFVFVPSPRRSIS